jgi:hypothetical protein
MSGVNRTLCEGGLKEIGLDKWSLIERDFGGKYVTALVAKGDAALETSRGVSQVDEYRGLGYEVLSEDPRYTGHGALVLMGMPRKQWEAMKKAESERQNKPFVKEIERNERTDSATGVTVIEEPGLSGTIEQLAQNAAEESSG